MHQESDVVLGTIATMIGSRVDIEMINGDDEDPLGILRRRSKNTNDNAQTTVGIDHARSSLLTVVRDSKQESPSDTIDSILSHCKDVRNRVLSRQARALDEYDAVSRKLGKELALLPPTYQEFIASRAKATSRRRTRSALIGDVSNTLNPLYCFLNGIDNAGKLQRQPVPKDENGSPAAPDDTYGMNGSRRHDGCEEGGEAKDKAVHNVDEKFEIKCQTQEGYLVGDGDSTQDEDMGDSHEVAGRRRSTRARVDHSDPNDQRPQIMNDSSQRLEARTMDRSGL